MEVADLVPASDTDVEASREKGKNPTSEQGIQAEEDVGGGKPCVLIG